MARAQMTFMSVSSKSFQICLIITEFGYFVALDTDFWF